MSQPTYVFGSITLIFGWQSLQFTDSTGLTIFAMDSQPAHKSFRHFVCFFVIERESNKHFFQQLLRRIETCIGMYGQRHTEQFENE